MQHRKIQDSPHEHNEGPPFGLNNKKSQQVPKRIYGEASTETQKVDDNNLKQLSSTECKSLSYLEKEIGKKDRSEPLLNRHNAVSFYLRK
jgi:hypothetical protein